MSICAGALPATASAMVARQIPFPKRFSFIFKFEAATLKVPNQFNHEFQAPHQPAEAVYRICGGLVTIALRMLLPRAFLSRAFLYLLKRRDKFDHMQRRAQ